MCTAATYEALFLLKKNGFGFIYYLVRWITDDEYNTGKDSVCVLIRTDVVG